MLHDVELMKKKGQLSKDVFKKLGLEEKNDRQSMSPEKNPEDVDALNHKLNTDSIGYANIHEGSFEDE